MTTKWSRNDNIYSPADQVEDVLPAGLYDPGMAWGRVFFKQVALKTDKLYLLPRTATETIMNEIQKFWTKRKVFEQYGILYKRGILLFGPPGTGKTSLINLVSTEAIKRDAICLRMKRDVDTFISSMQLLRKIQPERPIVVFIEDIDQWAHDTDLLDMLDGGSQIDNVVYIATTNYLEHLPPRIKNRPSRFDRRIEIDPPEEDTRREFFASLSNEPNNKEWAEWAKKTEDMTFAHMKELFISVKVLENDFDAVLADLRAMAEDGHDEEEEEVEDDEDGF
jgi:SpoVK/Ycf46/Vps4 family AAA+-type ATPase